MSYVIIPNHQTDEWRLYNLKNYAILRANFKTLIEMRFDMPALTLRTYFAV